MLKQENKRNAGIELFRIFAMYLIVILHFLGEGGVLAYSAYQPVKYRIAWYLESLGYCSVNCFAVISGYACVKSRFRLRKIIIRWLEAFFYLIVPVIVFAIFFKKIEIDPDFILRAFFPLSTKAYWYVNAYVFMAVFIPLMNAGIAHLTQKQHLYIMLSLLLLTTGIGGQFVLGYGYSGVWLMVLYITGAYFRLYGFPKLLTKSVSLVFAFTANTIAWVLKFVEIDLKKMEIIADGSVIQNLLSNSVSYISPFMVIMAVMFLAFFSQLNIKGKVSEKIIVALGSCSFGVYLFHVSPLIWYNFLSYHFKAYASCSIPVMVFFTLIGSVAMYLMCSVFSYGQVKLFKLLRVSKLADILGDFSDRIFGKILGKSMVRRIYPENNNNIEKK